MKKEIEHVDPLTTTSVAYGTYKYTYTTTGAKPIIYMLNDNAVLGLKPAGGNSKIEYTLGTLADITGGTAVWKVWTGGAAVVAYTEAQLAFPLTAIRVTVTTGTAKLWIQSSGR